MMLSSFCYRVGKDENARAYYDIRSALLAAGGDPAKLSVEDADDVILDLSDIDEVFTIMRLVCPGKIFNVYNRLEVFDGNGVSVEDTLVAKDLSFAETVRRMAEFVTEVEMPLNILRTKDGLEFVFMIHPEKRERNTRSIVIKPVIL